ncbi:MAG: TAXI family TRAP transporter solute-binding subunit [Defluviicoccus sp.]|nr:TAXI family TRAP transporter solute-binding subunit [Defluviicoccus sp.]
MRWIQATLATVAAGTLAGAAAAQTVGIGATKAGAVSQITATISKAVSEHAPGLQMRKQTMGGTQQYIPVVNAGELEFGISNIPQFSMAFEGIGLSKGNKYDNLRLVSTIMKFTVSAVVTKKSGITSIAQLKGKRMPVGFKGAPLFAYMFNGSLGTVGLTMDDIKPVPQVGLVQHWRAFIAGKIDWAIAAAGTGWVKQMDAKIDGGVRHISYVDTPESLKAMHKWFPKSEWSVVQPAKGLTGVVEPTVFVTYDFLLWTHKGMSDDVVYKVTKVMHTQEKQLKEGGPLWRSFSADKRLAKQHGYPYHPAAVKYYKEVGLWPAG